MQISRRAGVVLAGAGALALIAAFSFGPVVRAKLANAGEKRGLVITAGRVVPGWFSVDVHDVHVALDGVSGIDVDASLVHVDLDMGFHPRAVESHGATVTVHGTESELADALTKWKAARPPVDPSAPKSSPVGITADGIAIAWDDRGAVTGVSFVRDEDGSRVAMDHAHGSSGDLALDLTSAKADFTRENKLRELDIANADVAWTSDPAPQVAAQTNAATTSSTEPAPPPLPISAAQKKNPKNKSAPISDAIASPVALPNLHDASARLSHAIQTLAEHIDDDGRVGIESIVAHHVVRGSEATPLTLGPAKLTLLRHQGVMDASFSTSPTAEGARLSLEASLPISQGDTRVAISGGPISLAQIGAKEGAGGLADVNRASITARGSAILKADASELTIDSDIGVRDLGLSHPKLADDVVHGLEASMLLKATYDDKGTLSISDAEGTLGALRLRVNGSIRDAHDHLEGALAFDAPTAACQSLLDSIPTALVPDVHDMELTGTFGATGKLAFDTRELDDLELSYRIDDKCKFVHVPEEFDRERFMHPFSHQVYLPDGSTAEEETGPGSEAWTDLDRISPFMQVAVLTTEDGAFFKHQGFNHSAIRASIIANLKAGKFVRGASTISMQLTKNLFLSREKTVSRKLEEVILTDYEEQTFSKNEIMELYLNVIEFGPDIYGIGAAADHYFGRKPDELNLAESLFLSQLLPNPIGYHKLYEKGEISPSWARNIKTLMEIAFKSGKISQQELDEGLTEQVVFFKDDDPDHPKARPTPRPPVGGAIRVYEDEPFKPID
jgi:hypothetical protein